MATAQGLGEHQSVGNEKWFYAPLFFFFFNIYVYITITVISLFLVNHFYLNLQVLHVFSQFSSPFHCAGGEVNKSVLLPARLNHKSKRTTSILHI